MTMTDLEVYEMAIDLAVADIREAARDFFDLHPGLSQLPFRMTAKS